MVFSISNEKSKQIYEIDHYILMLLMSLIRDVRFLSLIFVYFFSD